MHKFYDADGYNFNTVNEIALRKTCLYSNRDEKPFPGKQNYKHTVVRSTQPSWIGS